MRRNLLGLVIAVLLAANLGWMLARTPGAHATTGVEYTVNVYGIRDTNIEKGDAWQDYKVFLAGLNLKAKDGWRVKSHSVIVVGQGLSHWVTYERPK
ncbi:MAG TPA: hypothetical protein VN914_14960 [Polyangia bacterium]|nr:hypothetical protein [Polyangia bacterium]